MSRVKTKFFCQQCGYESPKWLGRCPGCEAWNSMVEEPVSLKAAAQLTGLTSGSKPQPITEVSLDVEERVSTGINELDRVLGGGLVAGSLVLVGGDPGIGKSTLLLQAAYKISTIVGRVLYVSGEESVRQTKMRAIRLETLSKELFIITETDLEVIRKYIEEFQPSLVIIDSIQTMNHKNITSAAGSVSQVRECTAQLLVLAKSKGVPIFLVGHVTKEGTIAGPRVIEHMVDTVLYFEGERHQSFRLLRAVKNRFGSTNEIGIFEMREKGLVEVFNPSEMFLSQRPVNAAGSVVVSSMEGTRPVLVELQALVCPTTFGTPRRVATGVDYNRVTLIMAVMDKRMGLALGSQDAYINIAGGLKLVEPALDLGIALALASSFREVPISPNLSVIGEIGLTGEVRSVGQVDKRIREGAKLGFTKFIIPMGNLSQCQEIKGIEIVGVETAAQALDAALGGSNG